MRPSPPPSSPAAETGAPGDDVGALAQAQGWRAHLTLERRIALAVALLLLAMWVGGVAASIWATRAAMQATAARHADETAARLAAVLAGLGGDHAAEERLLGANWDAAAYRRLIWVPSDGSPPAVRSVDEAPAVAPDWFVRLAGCDATAGVATVSTRTHVRGRIELEVLLGPLQDGLWRAALRAAQAMTGLCLGIAALAAFGLLHLRRMFAPALAQARVLAAGRITTAAEPAEPQLQLLTRAMNGMVERLRAAVDKQVAQLEQLRQRAHLDPNTGLSNRSHFLAQLDAALQREDGNAHCGLVLMRLRDLAGVNRVLGHAGADRIIAALAQTLESYPDRVPGCIPGRLNGSDFALCLPVGGLALETAQTLADAMHVVLPALSPVVSVSLGAAELHHGLPLAEAMALADEALARAELRGAFGVEVMNDQPGRRFGGGESSWRRGLYEALAEGRATLSAFPLVDSQSSLVHLESPLRVQLQVGGAFEPAVQWLHLATRTRMTGKADARAVTLALEAIARDGSARSVNLASASLSEGDFPARLRTLLFAAPRAARHLSLEIDEAAAAERFALLRELVRLVRPCGVRFGLEHAGLRLASIDHLFEDWLDFVKLDPSYCVGTGANAERAGFVSAAVGLLHGLAIDVYAEGVCADEDAKALWACGVDGITGPWATTRFVAPR